MKPLNGVFCLEGYCSISINAFATLQLLRRNCGVAFFYQAPVTYEQFWQYLDRWASGDRDQFPILFLAFHGEEGRFSIGDETVGLEELAESLRGACVGKWLHISACSTLAVEDRRLRRFLRVTGFEGISGYDYDVMLRRSVIEDYHALRQVVVPGEQSDQHQVVKRVRRRKAGLFSYR